MGSLDPEHAVLRLTSNSHNPPTSGYAEPKEAAPKLALLDDFNGDPHGYPHGQAVESVLLSHSELTDQDIQRYQNEPQIAQVEEEWKKHGSFRTGFRAAVAKNVARFYLNTTLNLHTILKEQPSIKVISQSQGETSANQLGQVYQGLHKSETFRQGVAQSMGLTPDASIGKICEALLAEADEVSNHGEVCKKARQMYLQAAKAVKDRGIIYLVAAGNHGALNRELEALGVESSPSAFRNILANEFVTVVAANDSQGNPSTLNSPRAASEVYELGEDLPWSTSEDFEPNSGVDSGTSLATPIVAGRILEMLEEDPGLSPFEIESSLMGEVAYQVSSGQSVATQNGESLQGDGHIEPYILDELGEGFVTSIVSDEAAQFAEAKQDRTFFGLPGTEDHEFQLVRVAPDTEGRRQLSLETYFDEGYHVLKAKLGDGAWDPKTVTEELHLDPKRQEAIEEKKKS